MGRLLAAFCVLVVSCVLVEGDTADRLRLTTLSRTVSDDSYTFTVEFQAPTQPQVVWTRPTSKGSLPLTGSLSYNTTTQEGSAQLTVTRTDYPRFTDKVLVTVGDPASHFFHLDWNLFGDADLELDVNLALSAIAPSTDIAYNPGQSTRVVLTVENDRGEGLGYCENTPMGLGGYYFDSTENELVAGHRSFPFLTTTRSDQGGVTRTTYSFSTDQFTVNGAFRGSLSCFPASRSNSPISFIDERFVLSVHQAVNTGPFPDSFAEVKVARKQEGHNAVGCLFDLDICPATCTATANDLDTLAFFKIADDGTRTQIESSSFVDFYQIHLTTDLKANGGDVTGQYVCQASRKGGQPSVEDLFNVEKVTQKAKVESISVEDDGDAVLVTCDGSGSNFLQVELSFGRRQPFVVGENGVVSYTPGTPSNNGSATARVRVAGSSGTTLIMCSAKNSASSDIQFEWI